MIVASSPDFSAGSTSPLFTIPGLAYLGASKRRSPTFGEQWVLTFESAGSSNLSVQSAAQYAYDLVPSDYTAELDTSRATIHRLIVTTPDNPADASNTVISTTYELLGNANQKDIWEHPKALALTEAQRTAVKTAVRAESSASLTTGSDSLYLCDLILQGNGSRAFQVSQYVYRVTHVVSGRYATQVAFSNVQKIYTTDQMLAELSPPATILFSAETIVAQHTSTVPTGYLYGWLKQTPTVNQIAGNKFTITNEWWLEEWSTWIYETIA